MPIESKRQTCQQIKVNHMQGHFVSSYKKQLLLFEKLQKTNIAHSQESSTKEHAGISCTCKI